jgi:hypothetical protein
MAFPNAVMARLVRATYRGTVLDQVARTSYPCEGGGRAMTIMVKVNLFADWS